MGVGTLSVPDFLLWGLLYIMKDPAFLFYDGDAARDVSHMTRLERGCYFDLIQAQRKFRGFTVEQARKILGKDFAECWDAITLILECENDVYFIPWVKISMAKRAEFKQIQKDRIQNYWDKKKEPSNESGNTTVLPSVNENEIVIYSKFYDSEIENSIDKPEYNNYCKYVQKVYGKYGVYGKMDKLLNIKEQLTYEQFILVLKKSQGLSISLMDMLEKFDNYNGKYKPKTVYRSLLNWLDYEKERLKK